MPKLNPRLAFEITWRVVICTAAVAILVVITTRWNRWEGDPGWKSTDDAYLQADITPIATKVAGYLQTFPVQDFERVRAGQLLARIEDDDYRATVAQVQATLASARALASSFRAQLALQQANIAAADAVVAATLAALDQNTRDLARQHRLLAAGSASTASTEKLQTLRAQLTAQLAQNRAPGQGGPACSWAFWAPVRRKPTPPCRRSRRRC